MTQSELGTAHAAQPLAPDARTHAGLGRLLALLFPATTAMYAVYNGIGQILLPAQIEAIDPASKVGNLALITTIAAVGSLIALPMGGAVSDRTRSRFGRRTPWMVVMSVLTAVLLIALAVTDNLIVMGFVVFALLYVTSFHQGAIAAILPDRIPVERRGLASSVIGLGTPVGILVGVNLASRVSPILSYLVLATAFAGFTVLLVLGSREPSSLSLPPREKAESRRSPTAFARSFFSAFSTADFRRAFVSRFFLFLAYFTVSGYLFYTMQDYIGKDKLPGGDVAVAVATLSTVSTVTWVVVAGVAGWLADKLDRRKMFVGTSAVGMGVSLLVPILSPTWIGMLVYSVLSGAFIGIYFAVDLALMSLVLPDRDNEGRDFGILAVATGLPQILSSVIAGGLILTLGYSALYVFSALCAVLSGIVVFRIRSLR
ncbi:MULTISPECIES: MFS transporter [Nocardiaceae]|uniref:MFS family permease n=1 Tax=Rhodococcoides corynebacterioides TaxID=53972 RepID=A0ABS2KUE1_9NOCA|nr:MULTISPECIES: MFS transporter [Rhodococcus]MBM7415497.1 MFS family permease [Rhodococcus corynebacterioides]MBP1117959.1 MFS family permease [Rhodococcus sp. PvP016]